jgi:hypothetical protein
MMDALSRRILPYLLALAGSLACLWLAYSHGVSVTATEWQGKWDKQALDLAEAKAKALELVREEEQRQQSSINKVREDAEKQIALAERDALAASDAAAGLLEQAKRLAARAGKCPSNSSTSQSGSPAAEPSVVLADVLGRADARAGELAKAYDQCRASGLACERAYHSLSKVPTTP